MSSQHKGICSCGIYDYGTPGHDGDPARGHEAEQAAAAIAAARTGQELVQDILDRKTWTTEWERQQRESAGTTRAAQLPAPWELHDKGTARPYWWRTCEPNAGALIEALGQLPPDTEIQTSTGPEGDGQPDALWYYPHLHYVTI